MEDGELSARFRTENGRARVWELFPLGGNEFGIKRYSFKLVFGDGCLTCGGETCKKDHEYMSSDKIISSARYWIEFILRTHSI